MGVVEREEDGDRAIRLGKLLGMLGTSRVCREEVHYSYVCSSSWMSASTTSNPIFSIIKYCSYRLSTAYRKGTIATTERIDFTSITTNAASP